MAEQIDIRSNIQNNSMIVVFDGVCNFCNWAVNFIINRDKKNVFKFAPSQSNRGKLILEKYQLQDIGKETIIVIKNDEILARSEAVFEIFRGIGGGWKYLRIFKIFPRVIMNWGYSIFSRYRYNIFGKRDVCMIPSENLKEKFLD